MNYYEKVYAGFLGMNIGIRLGAPLEPEVWTEENIFNTYGIINGYVKDYINFAADDDVNGPVYFLRALDDRPDKDNPPGAGDVGNAWLNYTRAGQGMFWWGGYGISTEHTAYENLRQGIKPPLSGCISYNGEIAAQQIGGQIFIDTWGLIHPNDMKSAADAAEKAASVSHDGEGIYGARFIGACIAKAFAAKTIDEIICAGLGQIPENSLYYKVVKCVGDFYTQNPDDFRLCFQMLNKKWGYDKFEGMCHIIPNAGVCALALYYGGGNFTRTIEIAVMCGWDTDCNAGNVGTILGVFCGINGIPDCYRKPINDSVVLSGISGYLNILDIPAYAKEIAAHYYREHGQEVPGHCSVVPGEILFDFLLPGSTHNIRVSDPFYCRINPLGWSCFQGGNSLEILVDGIAVDSCRIFYKTFYGRRDFSDERYSPVFSPKAYPGQKVSIEFHIKRIQGDKLDILPYVKTFGTQEVITLYQCNYLEEEWFSLDFTIPDVHGDLIEEVGFILRGSEFDTKPSYCSLHIRKYRIYGPAEYSIDMEKQSLEFGTVTPFSTDGGNWTIEGRSLISHRSSRSIAYTGNYFSKDYMLSAVVTPLYGQSHMLVFRAKGAMMWYAAGLDEENKLALYRNHYGIERLAQADYSWELGKRYKLKVLAKGEEIELFINDELQIKITDGVLDYGMYGFGSLSFGRTDYSEISFNESGSKGYLNDYPLFL